MSPYLTLLDKLIQAGQAWHLTSLALELAWTTTPRSRGALLSGEGAPLGDAQLSGSKNEKKRCEERLHHAAHGASI